MSLIFGENVEFPFKILNNIVDNSKRNRI